MCDPKKYQVFTTQGDVVGLREIKTGMIVREFPHTKNGRQLHCPRSDHDIVLNGVPVPPCDNSVTA